MTLCARPAGHAKKHAEQGEFFLTDIVILKDKVTEGLVVEAVELVGHRPPPLSNSLAILRAG